MAAKTYTRRDFLKVSATSAASLWAASVLGKVPASKGKKKPNLLFLWTDQQRADTMAVYGNKKFKMPNLNKLSDESFVFMRPYVVQSVSTPGRGSVMTGLYPHQHGAVENNIPLNADARCFPELINDKDYRTGYFGKWHLGDEIFTQHGFEEFDSVEDRYSKHYTKGRDKKARGGYHNWLVSLGYMPDEKDKNLFSRAFCAKLPYEHSKPAWLKLKATDFMTRHQESPFILYINYLEPHTPYSGPFNEFYNANELDWDPSCPLNENDPARYRIREIRKEEEKWRKDNRNYAGLCRSVDLSVGDILAKLDELGLREDTIVVYTSDHGDMMGAHNLQHKSVQYEQAIKIPFMIRVPWLSKKQVKIEQPVSQIDIVPTLLELMGKSPLTSSHLPGESLVPALHGHKREDNAVFCMWNPNPGDEVNTMGDFSPEFVKKYQNSAFRTVMTDDGWKLNLSDIDKNQLFNLADDPKECNNLYYTGKYQNKIEELSKRIFAWQRRIGDTLPLTL